MQSIDSLNFQSKKEKVKAAKSMKTLKSQQISLDSPTKSKVKSPVKKSSPKRKLSSDESTKELSEVETDKKVKQHQKIKKPSLTVALPSSPSGKTKLKDSPPKKLAKKSKRDHVKSLDKHVLTKKRMASLNAKAILAASYENENYAARHDSSSSAASRSSSDSEEEDKNEDNVSKAQQQQPPTMKKEKKDVKMESEEVFLLLSHSFALSHCSLVLYISHRVHSGVFQRYSACCSPPRPVL